MQWWSNPSARSHLEAWVNIWVRSAGLALVIAGWLLVWAKRKTGEGFGYCHFFLAYYLFTCLYVRVNRDKQSTRYAEGMQRIDAWRTCAFWLFWWLCPWLFVHIVDIKSGLATANFASINSLNLHCVHFRWGNSRTERSWPVWGDHFWQESQSRASWKTKT